MRRACVAAASILFLRYEAFDLLYRLKTEPRYGLVRTEDEWLQLYAVINRLYGDIVDKLRNWPQLTELDVRVCYLVHARMSNASNPYGDGFASRRIADILDAAN